MEYKVTTADIEHFIADYLNSDHQDYQKYVKGIKLFVEYMNEKATPHRSEQQESAEANRKLADREENKTV